MTRKQVGYVILTLSLFVAGLSLPTLSVAQSVFQMGDQVVSVCKGFLTDSDAGTTAGHYDHNENYIFTICVPGASEINLDFSSFCTEQDYDLLRIFDGADTFATQIGPAYSGTTILPSMISTGSCLTIHFVSDANVTCTGWTAYWSATIEAPLLPDLILDDPNPICSTTVLTMAFSDPIPCDSVFSGTFQIVGPSGSSITGANPVGCVNDSTTQVSIQLSPGLDESGSYIVTYTGFYLDQCDSLWTLIASDTLEVNDCPLFVDLSATSQTICEGECTDLFADARGGDPATYSFTWSPTGPPGPGPWLACPATTTLYTVTLSDASGASPATDTLTITVLPNPTTQPNIQLCETDPPVTLTASPGGGSWSGAGIANPMGLFHPDSSGPGLHQPLYTAPNGCSTPQLVSVQQIWAGPNRAACPGSPSFFLLGAIPSGGSWGGPNVTPGGTFTPPATSGSIKIWYAAAGCTDTAEIFIGNPVIAPMDTICESAGIVALSANPPGGIWSGNGIMSPSEGEFDPAAAGPGSHTLTYSLFGCSASIDVFVKQIDIGPSFTACPAEAPLSLGLPNPAGGVWSDLFGAVTNPTQGIFDPSANGGNNFTDTIFYTVNGCVASKVAYVRQTTVGIDSLWFCREGDEIFLDWTNTLRSPWDGDWSGPGVIDPDFPGTFDPGVAGPGVHALIYTANTCQDSLVAVVREGGLGNDTSVCSVASPFVIASTYSSGIWRGAGIADTLSGLFDPGEAGIGIHEIEYQNPFGCLDTLLVEVTALPALSMSGLDPQYCYKDSLYALSGQPGGGVWSGPGIQGNAFNPALAGAGGPFVITYTIGFGECQQSASRITNVGPPLEASMNAPADSICEGAFMTLEASGSGGSTGAFQYRWSPGNVNGQTLTVQPKASGTYTVEVSDGCSDPAFVSAYVYVFPGFKIVIQSSEPVCFGEEGYAVAQVQGSGTYDIRWLVNPVQVGDTLRAPTGFNYKMEVTDVASGCIEEAVAEIPRHPYVNASFLPNPNGECVRLPEAEVVMLDQSTGTSTGFWDFGDGTTQSYQPGASVSHRYDSIGEFRVFLYLENEGGCTDTASANVCTIPPESWLFYPNAFSPNGDGINDEFVFQQGGIVEWNLSIYDRWGTQVFTSTDPALSWDGRVSGQPAPEGVYVFWITGYREDDNTQREFRPLYFEKKGTITLIR